MLTFMVLFVVLVCIALVAHRLLNRQLYGSLLSALAYTLIYVVYVRLRFGEEFFPLFGARTALTFTFGLLVSAGLGLTAKSTKRQPELPADNQIEPTENSTQSRFVLILLAAAYLSQIVSLLILMVMASLSAGRSPGNASLDGIFYILIFVLLQMIAACSSIMALAGSNDLKERLAALVPLSATLYFLWTCRSLLF